MSYTEKVIQTISKLFQNKIVAVVTVVSGIIAIVGVLYSIFNTDHDKLRHLLEEQNKVIPFLTKVEVSDSVINTPEYQMADKLQNQIELYFRQCELLNLSQNEVELNDSDRMAMCKQTLKLLYHIHDTGTKCNQTIVSLLLLNSEFEDYMDYIAFTKTLEESKQFNAMFETLAKSNKTGKQYVNEVWNFIKSKDIYNLFDSRRIAYMSVYDALKVIKLQIITEHEIE